MQGCWSVNYHYGLSNSLISSFLFCSLWEYLTRFLGRKPRTSHREEKDRGKYFGGLTIQNNFAQRRINESLSYPKVYTPFDEKCHSGTRSDVGVLCVMKLASRPKRWSTNCAICHRLPAMVASSILGYWTIQTCKYSRPTKGGRRQLFHQ